MGLSRPALDCPALDELGRELLDRELDGRLVNQEEAAELYLENLEACRQELAQVADISKAKLTIFLNADDMKNAKSRALYLNGEIFLLS